MSDHRFANITRNIFAVVFCTLLFAADPADAAGSADACANATPLPLGSILRAHLQDARASSYFVLEIPEPGVVFVNVSSSGVLGGEVRLGDAGSVCDALNEHQPLWIEQTARDLTFVTQHPGRFFFRVAGQDPLQPPDVFKVSAGFVRMVDLRAGAEKEEDDEVFEIEPDGNAAGADKEEDDEVFEIEPDSEAAGADKEEDDEVFEIEPDENLFSADESAVSDLISRQLCGLELADDHGDTPGCATLIADRQGEISGEIGNAWGDDQDYFALRVTSLETVQITVAGATDTRGSLYDRYGHRLAMDDDGGAGTGFRIVESLSPGLYFLEVEGSGSAEGPYRVRVDIVSW